MIVNNTEVTSADQLELLMIEMDEESKEGLRALYQEEINNSN